MPPFNHSAVDGFAFMGGTLSAPADLPAVRSKAVRVMADTPSGRSTRPETDSACVDGHMERFAHARGMHNACTTRMPENQELRRPRAARGIELFKRKAYDEPIPAWADRVAAREHCRPVGGKVAAPDLKSGANIRRDGEDGSWPIEPSGSRRMRGVGFLVLGRPIIARLRPRAELVRMSCPRRLLDGPRHRAGGNARLAPLIAADGLGLIRAGASPVRFGELVGFLPFETTLRL